MDRNPAGDDGDSIVHQMLNQQPGDPFSDLTAGDFIQADTPNLLGYPVKQPLGLQRQQSQPIHRNGSDGSDVPMNFSCEGQSWMDLTVRVITRSSASTGN